MNSMIGKPQTIKRVNLDVVLRAISTGTDMSQPEIAAQTGLSLQTVNKAVRELEESKTIICTGASEFTGGRRAKVYKVNYDRELIACVYIQDNHFYGRVTNLGEVVRKEICYVRDETVSWIDNLINCLYKLTESFSVSIIGVAVPGTVTKDIIYNIPAIPEFEGKNIKEILSEHFDCQIIIENDVKSATKWAYEENESSENSNFAYLSVLEHFGSAFIIGGEILDSNTSFSGEIAYMALSEQEKREDQTGCADQILYQVLRDGDTEKLINLTARIMVNICCVIAPDQIVLASSYLEEKHVRQIEEVMKKYIQDKYIPKITTIPVVPENNLCGIVSLCKSHLESTVQVIKK